MLSGPPVRYSFDPGTDRFPDVFESGAELGRHRGEAPYALRLRAPDDDDAWSWDFGDGATATGKTGKHTYPEAGIYAVTARRGDAVLAGAVRVDPGGPPRPLRATVGFNHHQVRVHFDEPVVIDDARFHFERLGPAGLARLEPGSQIVVVRTPRPIDQADTLVIEGVRDTALEPNRLERARLRVEPHDWPSRLDAMTLAWSTGDRQVIILDRETGLERSDEAVAHGRARLDHHYRMDVSGGRFEIHGQSDLGKGLYDAFALELTLEPDRLEAAAPGVVAGMGQRDDRINFLVLQEGSTLVLQLRTSDTPESGVRIPLGQLNGPGPHHLIVTYAAGKLAAYLDGEPMAVETPVTGTLQVWSDGLPLVIGAARGGDRPWHGVVEGVALYGHFVSPDEARRNAVGYAERREQRNAVDALRVVVRRRALSRTPTPEEITPYREGLVVHEYDVLDVRRGELGEDRIRVAHYAVQGGVARGIAGPGIDPIVELDLESFDENPQVQDIYQADDLELDLDVPLYLDVGP
ncbi:MAG: PKD domain-containing protein [Deltaproteobacteria bacterium]|nr:PKD domain-containing protein [Deltaproteobacteria bacterium]